MTTTLGEFVDLLTREATPVADGLRVPTERDLAELTGLGRSRIREYLSGLEATGLLEKVQGSGSVLRRPEGPATGLLFEIMIRTGQLSLSEVDEARELLEIGMAPVVASRVSPADVNGLEAHVQEMIDASAREDFDAGNAADLAFHTDLIAMLGNGIVSYLYSGMRHALHDVLHDRRSVALRGEIVANGGVVPTNFRTDTIHLQITHALRDGDPVAVRNAMTRHFGQWRQIAADRTAHRTSSVATD